MVMLVSLAQAKDHLEWDNSDRDDFLTLKIHSASALVLNYMKNGADAFTDSAGEPIEDSNGNPLGIPYEVQAATLLMVGHLVKNRDGDPDKAYSHGMLPNDVTALIYVHRIPSLR